MNVKDSQKDYKDLKKAVALLESPSITARISDIIGSPVELLVNNLPNKVQKKIHALVEAALFKSAEAALWSMENAPHSAASTKWHKLAAAASGAVGGFLGLPALPVELPISTTIMMRAVADIARSEGFDLDELGTKQSCIEVFALGGNTSSDNASESGYYIVRSFTAEAVQVVAKKLAADAAKAGTNKAVKLAPSTVGNWLAKLIQKVASRFGIVITEKAVAQAMPVLGAATGAALNTLFTDFYQDMAKGHFIIKRLEAKYGYEEVRLAYEEVRRGAGKANPQHVAARSTG